MKKDIVFYFFATLECGHTFSRLPASRIIYLARVEADAILEKLNKKSKFDLYIHLN